MPDFLKSILTLIIGGSIPGLWVWYKSKKKDASDIQVDFTKTTLEWTVQIQNSLDKANIRNEKLQSENERVHGLMRQMKIDFDNKIQGLEDLVELNQSHLKIEQHKNAVLKEQLKKFIDGTK